MLFFPQYFLSEIKEIEFLLFNVQTPFFHLQPCSPSVHIQKIYHDCRLKAAGEKSCEFGSLSKSNISPGTFDDMRRDITRALYSRKV